MYTAHFHFFITPYVKIYLLIGAFVLRYMFIHRCRWIYFNTHRMTIYPYGVIELYVGEIFPTEFKHF